MYEKEEYIIAGPKSMPKPTDQKSEQQPISHLLNYQRWYFLEYACLKPHVRLMVPVFECQVSGFGRLHFDDFSSVDLVPFGFSVLVVAVEAEPASLEATGSDGEWGVQEKASTHQGEVRVVQPIA